MAKIKKCINPFLIYVLISSILFIYSFSIENIIWDDIWNFHFIQGITEGQFPYRDMNIIVTPLFHYFGALFLKIFGSSFTTFELLGSMINSGIIVTILAIIKLYTKNKFVHIFTVFLLLSLLVCNFMPNYNYLMLLFPLIIIYLEKRNKSTNDGHQSLRMEFFIGFLLALMVLTKQTIGLVFSFVYFIYYLINLVKKNHSFSIKGLLLCALGGLLPLLLFLIFIISNHAWNDFINYCFGGIFNFGSKNLASTYSLMTSLFSFGLVQLLVYATTKSKNQSPVNMLFLLFGIASLLIAYPLANDYHVFLATIIPISFIIASFFSVIQTFSEEKMAKYNKIVSIFTTVFVAIVLILLIFKAIPLFNKNGNFTFEDEFAIFNGASSLSDEDILKIKTVREYIDDKKASGYNVFILSSDASLYEIPYKEWHKDYDLLLNGNLGYNGTNRVISDLSKIEKPLFLKNKFGEINFQECEEIEDYVISKYDYIESISDFRVFGNWSDFYGKE